MNFSLLQVVLYEVEMKLPSLHLVYCRIVKIKSIRVHEVKIKYKWKRCSKKKCCKQCGKVKFMGTMTIMARTKTHTT